MSSPPTNIEGNKHGKLLLPFFCIPSPFSFYFPSSFFLSFFLSSPSFFLLLLSFFSFFLRSSFLRLLVLLLILAEAAAAAPNNGDGDAAAAAVPADAEDPAAELAAEGDARPEDEMAYDEGDDAAAEWDDYDDAEVLAAESDEEYQRYLKEMEEEMLNDPSFRDELINEIESENENDLDHEDRDLLKIAQRLKQDEVRSRLEEQERVVVEKERRVLRMRKEHDLGIDARADDFDFHDAERKLFEADDVDENALRDLATRRIKLMQNIDAKNHEAFVHREMGRILKTKALLDAAPPGQQPKTIRRKNEERERKKRKTNGKQESKEKAKE